MNTHNYRNDARKHLRLFEKEFGSMDNDRLKYAALELRNALEALTYSRALAYKDELPPTEYATWQPRKLMEVLLEIDPMADQDSSLLIGQEEECGVPAPVMTSLGSEKVLNMATLRKHYHALGSYLHVQSLKQVLAGKPLNIDKIRSRCEKIAEFIRKVLSSNFFDITIGSFLILPCEKCGKPIRKRFPQGQDKVDAECFECEASYTLIDKGNGPVKWIPHKQEIECRNKSCEGKITFWDREIAIGKSTQCLDCKGRNTIVPAVLHEPVG